MSDVWLGTRRKGGQFSLLPALLSGVNLVCLGGGGLFATRAEIRASARQWTAEYQRNETRARFIRRLKTAEQRFGFWDEATGNIMLPMTPEVEQFLYGGTDDAV